MRAKPTPPDVLEQILSPKFQARFWAKVAISGPDDCWLWQASKSGPDGYGQTGVRSNGRSINLKAHKVAWISAHKRGVPNGLFVLHSCIAAKGCCNPAHLRPGTQQENVKDTCNQGRNSSAKGTAVGNSKFNEAIVLKMRELFAKGGIDYSTLARQFKMTQPNARSIITRHTWKHI